MHYRHFFIGLLITGYAAGLAAQTDSAWVQKWAIPTPGAVRFYTTDRLLQTYVVTDSQELVKYTPEGVEQFRYNNRRLGNLASVDVSNAFHILLYYPDYQTAITLDRTLNKTGEWNLLSFGLLNVPIVATSSDNQLWVYDNAEQRLKKTGADGNLLLQSDNLLQILGHPLQPVYLLDRGNFIYLSDPAYGIFVFDAQAQYHQLIPLPGIGRFQMENAESEIYYPKEGALWRYESKAGQEEKLALPSMAAAGAQVQLQRGHLFVLSEGMLRLFSLK